MKHPRLQTACTLLLAVATIGIMAVPQSLTAQPTSSGRIYNGRSEKCLQPLNGSKALGTPVVLKECDGSDPQLWYRTPATGTSGDVVHYVNATSGLCLDARGSAANNTPIQLWTCNQITNENWQYEQTSSDSEPKVVSRISGTSNYCLDIPGGGTNDGLALQIYVCNGSPAQHFYTP
jgi:Ricin-type beta-trefoil lectin domain